MSILRNGTFELGINFQELAKGLRPSKRAPRDAKYLVQSNGAVAYDAVLQAIEELELDRIDTSTLAESFPYPQIFVFTNVIIVCTETKIYEYASGVFTLKLTVSAGTEWTFVDFYDFIYGSNGKVAVRRRAGDKVWEETSSYPIATTICNYNGQVLVGAPDVEQT